VWLEVLDGLTVITNSSPPLELIMSSNSPQAAAIAAAIQQARSAQPGGQFNHIGDILTTPQLSLGSPWLDPSGLSGLYEPTSDETCEILPSQLLSRLREDSLGSITSAAGQLQVQFSGYDHFGYAVQVSSNLVDWVAVSTNYPSYGAFSFSIVAPPASSQQFYRTALLP
jgi:hypothetical protein